MSEVVENVQGSGKIKVPGFLMVLLILTALNVVWNLFGSIGDVTSDVDMSTIQTEVMDALENSGQSLDDLPESAQDALMGFIVAFGENYKTYAIFNVLYYVILGIAVFFMFKLKRMGLKIYTAIQLVGAIAFMIFFGANMITITVSILFLLWAGIWILLYRTQRKHLVN